jgi:hypothetical protein
LAEIEITSNEQFEAWMWDKPIEWVQVIGLRAALRVLPLARLDSLKDHTSFQNEYTIPLSMFRALLASWFFCEYSKEQIGSELEEAARSAATTAALINGANHAEETQTISTGKPVKKAAIDIAAADVARAAAACAHFVNTASPPSDPNASRAPFLSARAVSNHDKSNVQSFWRAIDIDTKSLLKMASGPEGGAALLGAQLWPESTPDWAKMSWNDFQEDLKNRDSNWIHFCRWYEERLQGRKVGIASSAGVYDRIATQPDEWWHQGSEMVNRDIAEWVETARRQPPDEEIDPTSRSQETDADLSEFGQSGDGWAESLAALPDQPNGFSFEEVNGALAIKTSGNETDFDAARDPITRHLHAEAVRRASDFAAIGGKFDNQIGWRGMGPAASRLSSILAQGSEATAKRIAEVWADVVELGSFLEQDDAIRAGQSTFAETLDVEMRRSLVSLVTIASTYIRRYPTAATLEMEASVFKTGQDLVPQARLIVEGARQSGLVNKESAEILEASLRTADRSGVQGSKARTVGVQSSRNIVGASAKLIVAAYVGAVISGATPNSILIGNGVAFYLATEKAVVEIVKDLPDHVGLAFKAMIDRLKTDPPVPTLPEPPRLEPTPIRKRRDE